jgi:putative transcriptional regulator
MNNNLKELRTKQNITGYRLAKQVGVTPSMIYMIENGQKKPSIMLAFKIANVLNQPIESIFVPGV